MNRFLLILLCGLVAVVSTAQNEYEDDVAYDGQDTEDFEAGQRERPEWVHNFRFGGEAGFFFSNVALRVDFTPMVGYQVIPDRLELGIGAPISYYNERVNDFKWNFLGFMGYSRVYVWQGVFAQVDGLTGRYIVQTTSSIARIRTGNVFVGGGYRTPIGNKAWMDFGLKINVLENDVYQNRWPSPFFTFFFGI